MKEKLEQDIEKIKIELENAKDVLILQGGADAPQRCRDLVYRLEIKLDAARKRLNTIE